MEEEEGASKFCRNGFCEECKSKESKYKCPACSLRTCSVPCVNAHKSRTGCSGKRDRTRFVPISQFDDNILLSDYNFLEETKRVAESARRIRAKLGSSYPFHFKLPFFLRTLRTAAASGRTKLLFLPPGMSRRETNQTRFIQRKKFISWTIEWRFHSTDVVLLDHEVHENTVLSSVIKNHLKPGPWNHPLRQFCQEQLDSLKFFIRKYPKGSKSPFRELDIMAPLRQQLADTVILEYPVIHVFLPSAHYDFVVRQNYPISHRPEEKESSCADTKIQKGITFKEEEIEEDDNSLDPQVFDLMKHQEVSSPIHQHKSEKAFSDSVCSLSTRGGAGNKVQSSFHSKEAGVFEDMEFDFDQGLIDAYSDLIAEIHPDDFLNLESEFAKQSEAEDRGDLPNSRGALAEELEEGEIVD